MFWILGTAALVLVVLVLARLRPVSAPIDSGFDAVWHDGRAELDGYRYSIIRYGQPRKGQAVMIFVTEPWSESKRVKVEDPSRDPADTFDVLKLNLVRDFQTGIYDYNTMVSVFTRSADFSPVEASLSSAEWCGHVYQKLRFQADGLQEDLWSYFEDESRSRRLEVPENGVVEDALFIMLRGLRGDYLAPGEKRTVPFLSGMLEDRLRHHTLEWTTAVISRSPAPAAVHVPGGSFGNATLYEVQVSGDRTGRFWVEPTGRRRMVKWTWTGPEKDTEASESGELTGTLRAAYWKLNGPGNEKYLRRLGIAPLIP
jgi:hypothetical protein